MSRYDWPQDWPADAVGEVDRLDSENKRLREAARDVLARRDDFYEAGGQAFWSAVERLRAAVGGNSATREET